MYETGSKLTTASVRVMVADSQALFAQCLSYALSTQPDLDVLPENPATGVQTVAAVIKEKPDVCVLDYWIKGMEGPPATATIVAEVPQTKVILVSWMHLPSDIPTAFAAGATGFLPKDVPFQRVADTIRLAFAGEGPIFPTGMPQSAQTRDNVAAERWGQLRKLTRRELEILRFLGEGFRVEDIAERLKVSPLTVKRHIHNTFSKTDTGSQLELLALARHYRVIPQ